MPLSFQENPPFNRTPQPSMIEKYLEQQKKVEGVLLMQDLPLVESYQMLQKNPALFFLTPQQREPKRQTLGNVSVSSPSQSDNIHIHKSRGIENMPFEENMHFDKKKKGAVRSVQQNKEIPSNIQRISIKEEEERLIQPRHQHGRSEIVVDHHLK